MRTYVADRGMTTVSIIIRQEQYVILMLQIYIHYCKGLHETAEENVGLSLSLSAILSYSV